MLLLYIQPYFAAKNRGYCVYTEGQCIYNLQNHNSTPSLYNPFLLDKEVQIVHTVYLKNTEPCKTYSG